MLTCPCTPCAQYSVPFATVYRLMSVVSANGFNDLPDHCLSIAAGLIGAAIALNLVRPSSLTGLLLPQSSAAWKEKSCQESIVQRSSVWQSELQ